MSIRSNLAVKMIAYMFSVAMNGNSCAILLAITFWYTTRPLEMLSNMSKHASAVRKAWGMVMQLLTLRKSLAGFGFRETYMITCLQEIARTIVRQNCEERFTEVFADADRDCTFFPNASDLFRVKRCQRMSNTG